MIRSAGAWLYAQSGNLIALGTLAFTSWAYLVCR